MKHNHQYINTSNIGQFIGRGLDFSVYHYGDRDVIKYSRLSLILGNSHKKKLIQDYTICKTYLKKYIVESLPFSNTSQYIEVQPYISGGELCNSDLKHKKVAKQLKDIIKRINKMRDDGYSSIDLIGLPGLVTNRFANIFIDQNHQLKIIDATLLEAKSIGGIGYLIQPLLRIASLIQDYKLQIILKKLN